MVARFTILIIFVANIPNFASGDYQCLCNYNVEQSIYASPSVNANILGTLYEFDCKSLYRSPDTTGTSPGYTAIQYEKQIGYVKTNDKIQEQVCQGSVSPYDLVTTKAPLTTSTMASTTKATPSTTKAIPTTRTVTSTRTKITSTTTKIMPTTTSTTATTIKSTPTTTKATPITTKTTSTTTIATPPPFSDGMNVTGTPLQYIGVGYNLLHGNPDGNPYGSSKLDEGFKLNNRILQLTKGDQSDVQEVQYAINSTSCSAEKHASILVDEKSYLDQLKTFVKPSNSHPAELIDRAFTLSIEFKHLYPITMTNMKIYRDVITTCFEGFATYNTADVQNNDFTVTKEFATAVCQLPQTYDIVQYIKFIETWGTSIVVSSKFGQRTIQRYHISKLQAFDHVQKTVPNLIQRTGTYLGYASSLSIDTDNYTITQSTISDIFGSLESTIDIGTTSDPVPINANAVPVTFALDPTLWNKLKDSGVYDVICPSSFNLAITRSYLETALTAYPGAMLAPIPRTDLPRIPITWPTGTYGLMRSNTGCPGGHVTWLEGWRKQDTEDHDASNYFSPGILNYMAGSFAANNLITHFCIKEKATVSEYDRPWPAGQYCLLQYNNCPTGFHRGYLLWDDEDNGNSNEKGGTLPTGYYDRNTKIYYCCRTDGVVSSPILLPMDHPFILLQYGSACQSVYGMKIKQLYVRWDDEDTVNFALRWGTHPFDDGGSKDHRLHFCHYQAATGNDFIPGLVG